MATARSNVRLYTESPLAADLSVAPGKDNVHYLTKVMRLGEGAKVTLFNGRDGEWEGTLKGKGKTLEIAVVKRIRPQTVEPDLWLAFAPIKRTRIDFVAQKAAELGASRLLPIRTRRTIVSRVNTARLCANAREGAEQTGRLSVPEVDEFCPLPEALAAWPKQRRLLFCDEQNSDSGIRRALLGADRKPARHPWGILIGPEGGFDEKERQLIRAQPFTVPASLGPRVLRADTAALAALALWQEVLGDW